MAAQQSRPLYFAAVVSSFFIFSSPILSGRKLDVCHTSTHDVPFGGFVDNKAVTKGGVLGV